MFVKRRAEWDVWLNHSLFIQLQTFIMYALFAYLVCGAGEAIHIVAVPRRLQWVWQIFEPFTRAS